MNNTQQVGIDVAIITMKEEEFVAALKAFDPTPSLRRKGKRRDYDISRIETAEGPCHVAITRCIQQGNSFSQSAATDIIEDLSPAFILVVGIAGGVPSKDFTLGDVILSSYIHNLTLEDTGTGSSRYNALGMPLHTDSARIVERLQGILRSVPAPKIELLRPSFKGSHTTKDAVWNKTIDESFRFHTKSQRSSPIFRAEPIASSDRLVKNPHLVKAWRKIIKAIACTEMEAAGVFVTCQRREIPVLAIRGISDIIGWSRDDAWTLFACETAARYAFWLVSSGAFCRAEAREPTNDSSRKKEFIPQDFPS